MVARSAFGLSEMLVGLGRLPGVGKTSIAGAFARAVGAAHIRIVSIEQAIRRVGRYRHGHAGVGRCRRSRASRRRWFLKRAAQLPAQQTKTSETGMIIREERQGDAECIRAVDLAAFETSTEADLVEALRRQAAKAG
jgi:predicted kinase